jgi:hypothetical protein
MIVSYSVFWCWSVFGVMLLALAVLSVVWHSSNAPNAQYIDLWSMDSCIAYLIVRITSTGAVSTLQAASVSRHTAEDVGAWCCAILYLSLVCTNALYWRANHRARWLHGACPFSGRARLQAQIDGKMSSYYKSSGYLHDSGGAEMHTVGAALYAGMPIIYVALPTLIQIAAIGSLGSLMASTVAATSLTLGWSLRMLERFCMDGSPVRPFSVGSTREPRCLGLTMVACAWHARTADDGYSRSAAHEQIALTTAPGLEFRIFEACCDVCPPHDCGRPGLSYSAVAFPHGHHPHRGLHTRTCVVHAQHEFAIVRYFSLLAYQSAGRVFTMSAHRCNLPSGSLDAEVSARVY